MNNQGQLIRLEKYFTDNSVGNYLGLNYKGRVCENIAISLNKLGIRTKISDEFDKDLENSVLEFQKKYSHKNQDGYFGPGTRKLLALRLLEEIGDEIFDDLIDFSTDTPLTLFISYAHLDREKVNKIDQWLRDNGIKVKRDIREFKAGYQLEEEIEKAIIESDKVLIIYSQNSKNRDWTNFELYLSQNILKTKEKSFTIYLVLDDAQLPASFSNKIAIMAKDKKLKEIGIEILHSVLDKRIEPPRYDYDEEEPL